MTNRKRKHDDSLSAMEFFKTITVEVPGNVQVSTECTVNEIRAIALAWQRNPTAVPDWMGNFPHNTMCSIFHSVLEDSSYEDFLDSKKIACTGACDREFKIQQRLVADKRIKCKTDAGTTDVSTRSDSISLVLGPSGSGKTTFCVNEQINNNSNSSASAGKEFRVYMYSTNLHDGEGQVQPHRLRETLGQLVRETLGVSSADRVPRLEMTLYAIIDEAGNDDYFANTANLNSLRQVVEEFATNGQLVLSGTGLDLLTTDIGSTGEGIKKIRMLPWGIQDFAKLAKDNSIVRLVQKHIAYGAMVSNPRAACFLLKWLEQTQKWGEPDDNVPHVIRGVAYDYISANGLKDMNDQCRRKVVRAVLKVLEACKFDGTTIPPFEQDLQLLSKDELSKAKSLIDVHVTKTGTTTVLYPGHHYAVSVTPAITLVLATLLGSSASLVHQWSGFEAVIALQELFKVAAQVATPHVPACRIVQLDKPYDARAKSVNLLVPVMDPFTVLINGKRASHADVIAYRRVIQAKHCEDSNGNADLYLKNELSKMGLLICSPPEKKIFARALYEIWKRYNTAPTPRPTAGQEQAVEWERQGAVICKNHRCLYPASLLVSEVRKQMPVCWKLQKYGTETNSFWAVKDSDGEPIEFDSKGSDDWIEKDKPLTVVFVTNGRGFKVKQYDKDGNVEQGVFSTGGILRTSTGEIRQTLTSWTTSVLAKELIKGVVVELVFAKA